jgi:hypothetical protein
MNLEKYTQDAQEAFLAAQRLAQDCKHIWKSKSRPVATIGI